MADNSDKIAQLQAIRDAGIRSVANDGTSISYDPAAVAKALREAQAADDTHRGRRPAAPSINLTGF